MIEGQVPGGTTHRREPAYGLKVTSYSSGTTQAGTAASFILSAMQGHFRVAGAIAAAGVGTANLAARAMTRPAVVRWFAISTRAPQSALPALLNQAAQSKDPDLHNVGQAVQQQYQQLQ